MSVILVTGASGFLGRALAERLKGDHEVIALSRTPGEVGTHNLVGAFHSFEDLRGLDGFDIDTVLHLAAVMGDCSEEDGMAVNVLGTRRLVRYLIDRGVRRFVLASSICAYGGLTSGPPPYVPRRLPMRPDDRYLGHDAYGLSKWLMEEVVRDFARQRDDADFTSVRIGAVVDDREPLPEPWKTSDLPSWAFTALGRVALSDVIDALATFVQAPHRAGERTVNLVGSDLPSEDPAIVVLRSLVGDRAPRRDLSYYEQPGNEHAALYSMDETEQAFGVVPKISVRLEHG